VLGIGPGEYIFCIQELDFDTFKALLN
jgi:hypothetical protein